MSLNDPRWGRNGSEDKKTEEPRKDSDATESSEESSKNEFPEDRNSRPGGRNAASGGADSDLEDLWKQFNEQFGSIFGTKKRDRRTQEWGAGPLNNRPEDAHRPEAGKDSSSAKNDYEFEEPPLRENHDFTPPPEHDAGGGKGGLGRPDIPMPSKIPGGALAAAVILGLGIWAASGFYIVPEGQKGVVTTFGKYSETAAAGFRWHFPYPIQDVSLVDISSVRKAEIGMKSSSQRLREALMLTDDENIVDVMFNVQYRIKDGKGAQEFLFRTRDPMGAVVQAAESAMREVVGRKKMDSVLFESKQEIAEEVKRLMQEMLDRYRSGIQILSVAIQNAQPPEQVQAAFNDAVKAGQDRERQINEGEAYANDVIPKAKGMAERLRQEAEAYRAGVISQAEGDTSRFNQVYEQYSKAPKVTRDRMYVDTMQQIFNNTSKVMVDNASSNNLLYLPLDQLLKRGRDVAGAQGAGQISVQPGVKASEAAAPAASSGTDEILERMNSRALSRNLR